MTQASIYSALFIFAVFVAASMVIDRGLRRLKQKFDTSSSEVFALLSNSQRAVLIFCGLVLAISELGFDVSALVAGLGLTGFAIGFALKDAISNLIAGIMIVLYKPIQMGNVITINSTKGTVVNLNLRYITLESDQTLHLIPNSLVLNHEITVHEDR